MFIGFLGVKSLPANAGDIRDLGLTPGLGRSPRRGHGNSLQYSCLENSKDREAWRAVVHRITKSQTQLKQLAHMHGLQNRNRLTDIECKLQLLKGKGRDKLGVQG